MTVNMTVSV